MPGEKKVTVQFFANDKLKPKEGNLYPLYVTVIYQGNNTQFKANLPGKQILVSKGMDQIDSGPLKKELDEYADHIQTVVYREIDTFGNNFSLAGLGKRLLVYRLSLKDLLHETFIGELAQIHNNVVKQGSSSLNIFPVLGVIGEKSECISAWEWFEGSGKKKILALLKDADADSYEISVFSQLIDVLLRKKLLG